MCRYVISAVSLQVWSTDAGVGHSPPSDLLWKSQASWGTGNNILTVLLNADGEVGAPIDSNLRPIAASRYATLTL